MNKFITGVITTSCLLSIGACESDSVDDDDRVVTEAYSHWGLVTIDTEGEVEIAALFGKFEMGLPLSDIQQPFLPELDQCEIEEVSIDAPDDGDDDLEIEFDVEYELISAGEALFIDSPSGTYATLNIITEDNSPSYRNESGSPLNGPAPANLNVSIGGDVFPAFSTVSIPAVRELAFSSPADGEFVTAESTFRWNATNETNSYVSIAASYLDEDQTEVTVDCLVVDDGEFLLPKLTMVELGAEFSTDSVDFSRTSYRFITGNNAVLVLRNTQDI